ncbi:MAG: NAD(P)-dependent oxidoreductase [Chloroflexi bacterium]|nr:NAD(P)-dependent oxidoreductase [Chloroflexota bacterium]MBV9893895.1 NAD(P)-dependent oxidoreductase [Chloroflexota bacterium]
MTLVAITGGAGNISTAIRPLLREHYQLRLLDVREPASDLAGDEFRMVNVANLEEMESALDGADAVVHLAANPSTQGTWDSVLPNNIVGTRNVFEAARRQGANKIVFASTNHVMGFYNLDQMWPVTTHSAVRPDSLYGVSKAFGEALGQYYSDAFGLSVICLRIGWFTVNNPSVASQNPLWISARDLAQIVRLSLETPRRFGIYNATSNNPQRHWDLTTAREELGFTPEDDVSSIATETRVLPYVDPRAGVLREA